jgi:hypothetical protein
VIFSELKSTASWRALPSNVQELLTTCIVDTNFDIVAAVAKMEPHASLELQTDLARRVLENGPVQEVIALYVFGLDLAEARKVPLAPDGIAL